MSDRPDEVLLALLSAVEESDRLEPGTARVPVTLNCNGLLLWGELISRSEYARTFKKKVQTRVSEVSTASRPIEAVGTSVAGFVGAAPEGEAPRETSPATFLHMLARIPPEGGALRTSAEPFLWRCPVSAVQGFSFGTPSFGEEPGAAS